MPEIGFCLLATAPITVQKLHPSATAARGRAGELHSARASSGSQSAAGMVSRHRGTKASGLLEGGEDGRPSGRQSSKQCDLAAARQACFPQPSRRPSRGFQPRAAHGMRFEGRTWGLITQWHTATPPARRPPARMFGAHPFPRAGKGIVQEVLRAGINGARKKKPVGGKLLEGLENLFQRRRNS